MFELSPQVDNGISEGGVAPVQPVKRKRGDLDKSGKSASKRNRLSDGQSSHRSGDVPVEKVHSRIAMLTIYNVHVCHS